MAPLASGLPGGEPFSPPAIGSREGCPFLLLRPPSGPHLPSLSLGPGARMATENDRAVLRSIFHPDTPFAQLSGSEEEEEEEEEEAEGEGGPFDPELLGRAVELEARGVAEAEAGQLEAALGSFGAAIGLLPGRASAYNNRAQALRLKGDLEGALRDLEAALGLSGGRGLAARQGFVQRGLVRLLRGHEDQAREDFARAARLGSAFARQQLLRLNPYAALCNQMLSGAMRSLLRGDKEGEEGGPPGLDE